MENLQSSVEITKVYKTPIYTRKAVKNYEEKMKKESPEKYKKRLEYQRNYYKKTKEKLALLKQILEQKNI